MSDFFQEFGNTLAAVVTAEVMKNLRRELAEIKSEGVRLCYSEKEAANLLGCSSQTLYRKRVAGEISFSTSPGGRIVYTPEQLSDYLRKTEIVRVGGKRSEPGTRILDFPRVA